MLLQVSQESRRVQHCSYFHSKVLLEDIAFDVYPAINHSARKRDYMRIYKNGKEIRAVVYFDFIGCFSFMGS